MHSLISSGIGSLFFGGRHFAMLAIKISDRFIFRVFKISPKSSPARPTKGFPSRSSFFPGASPISIKLALGFPSPKMM